MRASRSVVPRALVGIVVLVSIAVAQGCAASRRAAPPPRVASDVPDRFLVGSISGDATSEPAPGGACRSPMVDPRDGARLTMVRSSSGQGDYQVPPGRYGVAANELLRLDCGTGRPLGIVPR